MRISPLADVVIIERQNVTERNGILIPIDSKDFREDIGTVRYCGETATAVKPGDKVLFSTHGHQVTTIDGVEVIVLRQPSIIGVLHD